jgi:hypothetical protein
MKIKRASYSTSIIQDTCGFKDVTEKGWEAFCVQADKEYAHFYHKRGVRAPTVSKFNVTLEPQTKL